MNRQEIRERYICTIEQITEATDEADHKYPRVSGVGQRADYVNQNRRIYPKELLQREVGRLQPLLAERRVLGLLDHPSFWTGPSAERIALVFTKLEMSGTEVRFEADLIDTEAGQTVTRLVRAGIPIGVSSRGYVMGDEAPQIIDLDGTEVVVMPNSFQLEGFDVVLEPSVDGAEIKKFIEELLKEQTLDAVRKTHPELFSVMKPEADEDSAGSVLLSTELLTNVVNTTNLNIGESALEPNTNEQVRELEARIAELTGVQTRLTTAEARITELEQAATEAARLAEASLAVATVRADCAEGILAVVVGVETYEDHGCTWYRRPTIEGASATHAAVERLDALVAALNRDALLAYIDQKVEGEAFAQLLAERLASCQTVEQVNARFEEERSLIEAVVSQTQTLTGKGQVNTESEETEVSVDPEWAAARRYAGLD